MADVVDQVRPYQLCFVKGENALNASFCLCLEDAGCGVSDGTGTSDVLTVVCESADLSENKCSEGGVRVVVQRSRGRGLC